jgi:hypothetical protein
LQQHVAHKVSSLVVNHLLLQGQAPEAAVTHGQDNNADVHRYIRLLTAWLLMFTAGITNWTRVQ